MTLARLSRVSGKYHMLIASGEALNKTREDLESTHWDFSPHTWVRLHAPWSYFTDALRSNHLHLMYGDFTEELAVLCSTLGVAVEKIGS